MGEGDVGTPFFFIYLYTFSRYCTQDCLKNEKKIEQRFTSINTKNFLKRNFPHGL